MREVFRKEPAINTSSLFPSALPRCPHCGGECAPSRITLPLCRSSGAFVLVRNIPAEVCQACGEPLFSVPTAGHLVAALQPDFEPMGHMIVPMVDLSAAPD